MPFSDEPVHVPEHRPLTFAEQVTAATTSEIEFAVGILASRHYVSPQQAFDCLRIARRRADRKGRDRRQVASPADDE